MGIASIFRRCAWLLTAVLLLLSPPPLAAQTFDPSNKQPSVAPLNMAAAMAAYRRALEAYQQAQQSYAATASAYWSLIAEKRRTRMAKRAAGEPIALEDYVLIQPPVYTGPPRPRDPSKPNEEAPPAQRAYVPIVADFLAAAQHEYKFAPRLPQSEAEYKHAYVAVAQAAGLTKDQAVRVYSFEATGNGDYDIQAGLEFNKHARAITTALGYNQLLSTNSVEIVAESGNRFVEALKTRAAQLSDAAHGAFLAKIAILRRMIDFARSVPDDWSRHEELASTQKGLAIHALNLDVDIGPYLQTQKLMDSVNFARRKGYGEMLSAAALEMMNLTGDGNGYDMVTMPAEWRDKVPTSNFFQRSGYRENPVAQRNNVVAKLLAATNAQMDNEVKKPGAKELAAAFR